jgi:CheY-like chemotaxis protein
MTNELLPTMNLFKNSIKDNDLQQKFQKVEKSIQQTSDVVSDFFMNKRNENELRSEVNINDTILEALKELKKKLLQKIEIKYSFDPGVSKMMTYPIKIKNLIEIFSKNSVEAVGKEGFIKVSTKMRNLEKDSLLRPEMIFLRKGKYLEIIFEDNGIGIDSRILPQIFKPYFSTKIRNDVIGLGLFVAYNIERDLEGEIFVRSERYEYTKFFVYIPYKGDIEMQEVIPGMAEAIKERSPTVLVVDDEFNIRSMLKEVLEMNGYHVYTAANGQEGIDIFKKHAPQIDLIILDMVMPVMDGKQTFREIQKFKKDQKVIIISGYAKKEDLREILNKGALAFMSKPFQIDSIVEKVTKFVQKN